MPDKQFNDILCSKIFSSIITLEEILDDTEGKLFLDVDILHACQKERNELTRLKRTLNQYNSKSKNLTYVGIIGHFSSGKSSTINSLLGLWNMPNCRLTGLHPTDKAVTLITSPANSTSLLGLHSRGELEVGSTLIDNKLLDNIVIVDTPGSGDPTILNEMVRDFLPICDRIIYVFSATNPLDESDLPILLKTSNELPFIPTKIIVTRSNEFSQNKEAPVSEDNFDAPSANHFKAELISRITAATKGKATPEEDILLIDNIHLYNIDLLADFICGQANDPINGYQHIHSHKIVYFNSKLRLIRNFFLEHANTKLTAIESLYSTAKNNHELYQETVMISNNKTMENWRNYIGNLQDLIVQNSSWIQELISSGFNPSSSHYSSSLNSIRQSFSKELSAYSEKESISLSKSIKSQLSKLVSDKLLEIHKSVKDVQLHDIQDLHAIIIKTDFHIEEKELKFGPSQLPESCRNLLLEMESKALEDLKWSIKITGRHLEELEKKIKHKDVYTAAMTIFNDSKNMIYDMLDEFFKSANVYKAAILAINAREIAEKLSIGKAIDDLERHKISDARKEEYKRETISKMFPEQSGLFSEYENITHSLLTELNSISHDCKISSSFERKPHVEGIITDKISNLETNLLTSGASIINKINETFHLNSIAVLSKLKNTLSSIANEGLLNIERLTDRLKRRRIRRLLSGVVAGSAVGASLFIFYYFSFSNTVQSNLTNVIIGISTQVFFITTSWAIVNIVDKTNLDIENKKANELGNIRVDILDTISNSKLEDYSFVDDEFKDMHRLFFTEWSNLSSLFIQEIIHKEYNENYSTKDAILQKSISIANEYKTSTENLLTALSSFHQNSDNNLIILQKTANAIKEEAILPSFRLFEKTQNSLADKALQLRGIEIG